MSQPQYRLEGIVHTRSEELEEAYRELGIDEVMKHH